MSWWIGGYGVQSYFNCASIKCTWRINGLNWLPLAQQLIDLNMDGLI